MEHTTCGKCGGNGEYRFRSGKIEACYPCEGTGVVVAASRTSARAGLTSAEVLARTAASPERMYALEGALRAGIRALRPRGGVARHVANAMATRIKARAQGLGEEGAGAYDHERAFRVYRDTGGGSTAVPSMNHVGRGGLLTLEEAMKVRAANPNTWIGQMPPVNAPRSAILRVEV